MSVKLFDNVFFTVEIGFATTSGSNKIPLNGALTDIVWSDVSAYVRDVSTNRGRNSELDEFSTGTAQIVLSNANRWFDPEYSSGPFFGALTPGRPIRIRAQYNTGPLNDIFFGFVDSWEQQYNYPSDATVSISCSDAFKVLNQLTLPGYYDTYTESLTNMASRYKLSEGTGSIYAQDILNNSAPLRWIDSTGTLDGFSPLTAYITSSATNTNSVVSDTIDNSAALNGNAGLLVYPFDPYTNISTNAIGASIWFNTSSTTDGTYGLTNIQLKLDQLTSGMVVSSGIGTIKFLRANRASGVNEVWTSTVKVNDGKPHLLSMPVGTGVQSPIPTVDGVPMSYSTTYTAINFRAPTIGFANNISTAEHAFTRAWNGAIDDFIIWKTALPNFVTFYQAGTEKLNAGQKTNERITTILNLAKWMTDGSSLTSGLSTVIGIVTLNKTVLAAIKECETAEQGRLFIDASGKVKFISRNAIQNTSIYNTSQRTYGDGVGELQYKDVGFTYNDRLIKNKVTVSRVNGDVITKDDAVSQSQYFIRADSVTNLITDNDGFSTDLAIARLDFYKNPSLRIESLVVNPRANKSILFPAVLGDEIGTRITVVRRPQNVGSAISKELTIEGISHRITSSSWETVYSLSPVAPVYFVLDSSTQGRLDVNRLGF